MLCVNMSLLHLINPYKLEGDIHTDVGLAYVINETLWNIEDRIRKYEMEENFGEEFVQLARSVYKFNDKRSVIKKKINIEHGSNFVEEKSYA